METWGWLFTSLFIPFIIFISQRYLFKPRVKIEKIKKVDNYYKIEVKNKTFFKFNLCEIKATLHNVEYNCNEIGSTINIELIQDSPIVIYAKDKFVFKNKEGEDNKIKNSIADGKSLLFRISFKHSLFGHYGFKERCFSKKDTEGLDKL